MAVKDLHSQTPHVLDKDDAQGDRNGPKFADHQRLNLLVGADIAGQHRADHQTVGMGDIGPGQTENPRVSGELTLGQLGQLAVIAGWQIVADLAQLLFDQVKVVQKPFSGGHDGLARLQSLGAGSIRL